MSKDKPKMKEQSAHAIRQLLLVRDWLYANTHIEHADGDVAESETLLSGVKAQAAELTRLREIVEMLPKTADGVAIYSGMKIYTLNKWATPSIQEETVLYVETFESASEVAIKGRTSYCSDCGAETPENTESLKNLYSTREAAEAAAKDKE